MRANLSKNIFRAAVLAGALLAACGKSAPSAAPAAAAPPGGPTEPAHAKALGDWTESYAGAVRQAKAAGKKILLNFTGSDWCVNCWRLDDEVFSKPAFADYAAKSFVLVTVDLPIRRALPDAVKQQNDALQAKYQVENLPTLIVLDGDEKELAWVQGYKGEGVAGLLAELENSRPPPAATSGQPLPLAPAGSAANDATQIPNAPAEPASAKPVSPPSASGQFPK